MTRYSTSAQAGELQCYDVRDEDDEFILVCSIDFLAGTWTQMINDLRVGVG